MQYSMPEHFRWKLSCKDCPSRMEADGHYTMAEMDAYLSAHIKAFGHTRYDLQIDLDSVPAISERLKT